MCGIIGALAQSNIVPILMEGLKRLEYRGYDSCGVAVYVDGQLKRVRSVTRVVELAQQTDNLSSTIGIAHTRWATHGAPTTTNAHPHFSNERIAVVHNGIIENYDQLRRELQSAGYVFTSQTDTEVIAHLVGSFYEGDLFAAVRQAVPHLRGAYAIAVFCRDEPQRLVGAREGSPLVAGLGVEGSAENFLASDAMALSGTTQRIVYLEDGDVIDVRPDAVSIVDRTGRLLQRAVRVIEPYAGAVELSPYQHFMQKEIFEQPRAIADTLASIQSLTASLFGEAAASTFKSIDRVLILACGTSYYAGCTAKFWLEAIAKLPTNVEIASEYRYRDSVSNPNTLVVVISQSGETADTLAALKHAKSQGMAHTLAICNVASSAMVRETALQFLTHAGMEIGVASTKGFTTQLVALYVLAHALAKSRAQLDVAHETAALKALRHLPAAVQKVLALEPAIIAWAEHFARKENALFLGRGLHYPIALEGALKLKEISYIHAEAYPAGELKHGPLALVTDAMPVVTVAPNDALLEKLKSNMQEVRARGGQLYVFADSDTQIHAEPGVHVIQLPEHYGALSPLLHVVPLQLLAYHTALVRGTDVDKPRNLAKSVTVE